MLLHFASKPTPFFAHQPSPAGSGQLCRAGSGFTLDTVPPQDGWDMSLVSGATPAPGERSWKTISLSIQIPSSSKPAQRGQRRSRSPPGAAQKQGHDVHAASSSTGSLVLAFLGQQSFPSLALAVVLQSYPFLKSTPHKYFVKHLLANVLFLIFFFLPWLLGRDAHSPIPLRSAALAVILYMFVGLKLPGLCLQVELCAVQRVVPHGGSQRRMTAFPFTPCILPSTLQMLLVPPSAPLSAESSPGERMRDPPDLHLDPPHPFPPKGPPSLLSILGTLQYQESGTYPLPSPLLSHLHICLQLFHLVGIKSIDFHVQFKKQVSGGAGEDDNPDTTCQG